MFEGLDSAEKDPRKSLHVDEVDIPPLGPNEVLIAPMASALNFNTVWTSIFEPLSTFGFLERFGKESDLGERHDLDYHIVGSDAAAVVLRVGPGRDALEARRPRHGALQLRRHGGAGGPRRLDDRPHRSASGASRRTSAAWPRSAMVKANQLMPMPTHLSWEEAAVLSLTLATSYRMLVSPNARGHEAGRHRADLGRDGRPRRVRGPAGRATAAASRSAWCGGRRRSTCSTAWAWTLVIDRKAEGYEFWKDGRAAAQGVAALRQEDPRVHRWRRRRHRL